MALVICDGEGEGETLFSESVVAKSDEDVVCEESGVMESRGMVWWCVYCGCLLCFVMFCDACGQVEV